MRDVMMIDQLAEYLQIPKSTLYKLVQDGKAPGKKVGRQWRFHRETVDAWLADRPDLSGGEPPGGPKPEGQI